MRISVLPFFFGLCLSTGALAGEPAAIYRPTVITTEWPDYAVPGVMNNVGTVNTLDFNDLGQIRFYRGDVAMIYIDGVAYPIQMVDFDPAKPAFYLVSDLNDQGQLLAMTCAFSWGGPDACDIVRLDFVAVVPEPPVWLMLAGGVMLVSRRLRRSFVA